MHFLTETLALLCVSETVSCREKKLRDKDNKKAETGSNGDKKRQS